MDDDAPGRGLMSRPIIERFRESGDVVIHPFRSRDVKTTSYDVRLGRYYFRRSAAALEDGRTGMTPIFNPFDEDSVRRFWGNPQEAVPAANWGTKLKGIPPQTRVIMIQPSETILAHTLEFIGGQRIASTEMRARSTMGRLGITICKCAGWGDVGYINRWTMEITNHLPDAQLPLVVGMRLAQIIFRQVDEIPGTSYAQESGKYQTSDQLEEIIRSWRPNAMLPKLFKDYELEEGFPEDELVITEAA